MKAFNFVSWMNKASVFSALLLAGCAFLLIRDGGPIPGVEFTGGTELQIRVPDTRPAMGPADIREILLSVNSEPVSIQAFGIESDREFLIRFSESATDSERVKMFGDAFLSACEKTPNFCGTEILKLDFIGPNVGREFVKKALIALVLGCFAVLFYLIFRFELAYAVGAVAALLHDVFITMGFLALFDKEVTLSIVAALLMVIGYSVNDTIVIFDRIREVFSDGEQIDSRSAVNLGITRTISRTVLTTITVFIVLIPLFILGGSVIHDFAFTLIVGVIAGTYSSIFVAPYFVRRIGAPKTPPEND